MRPRLTAAALALLAGLWLLRWAVRGEPWPLTPFNAALLLFAVTIPVAMWASAFPDVTTPKAARLLLGLAAFRAVAFAVKDRRSLDLALAAFCLLGLGIAAAGALGVQWPDKAGVLGAATRRLPRLFASLPEDQGTPGVNANHLAGGIVLYVPLALALLGRAWGRFRRTLPRILGLLGAGAFLLTISAVLLLTQSRAGWVGGLGGLFALATLAGLTSPRRRARLLGLALPFVALAALGTALLAAGPQEVAQTIYDTASQTGVEEAVGAISLAGRVEIWSRALYAIQDFPFTGCGLGAFSRVVPILYPLFRIAPDVDIGHAHNIYLQTAVDVGLPGLIAYLALLLVALAVCWRLAGSQVARRQAVRPVALGLAAGLIAWHTYGLADAVALGTKPAVVLWVALGLVAALPNLPTPTAEGETG